MQQSAFENAGRGTAAVAGRSFAWREIGPALATVALPFALVLYLALKGGGYDLVVRSEVGIAIWWLLLLGALVGVLPVARLGAAAWVGIGLLAAFTVWTALGIGWSESSESSVAEVGRVATYLGVLVLAISVQGRDGLRRTISAVAAAIALVGAVALLSRLHPSWFPPDNPARFLPKANERLNYPLDYWNGLAALMALGLPLLLTVAAESRRLVTRALAAAAIPVLSLVVFYTLSRGGVLEFAAALVALVALHPRRLALLPTLLLGAAGSALVIAGATQRDALQNGLGNPTALHQGNEMLAFVLVVCAGAALVQVAIGLMARHGIGPRVVMSREATVATWATVAVVAVVAALAAGLPSELSDRWDEFKSPQQAGYGVQRLESSSGGGRYQLWQAAADANATAPLIGIGPGTFEYWWARNASVPVFVRDAHSLYMQTLGELGIVGFVLITGFIVAVLGVGAVRAFRRSTPERAYVAAGVAAVAAFATAAAFDWEWQLTVVPVALLIVAGAILARPNRSSVGEASAPRDRARTVARIAIAVVALPVLVMITIPMAATSSVRDSQAEVRNGDLGAALSSAKTAESIQPYAATPRLQEALVLEVQGELDGAAAAARRATSAEPTNWRTWLTLSRIEAENGDAPASLRAYRRARALNPLWPPFATPSTEAG